MVQEDPSFSSGALKQAMEGYEESASASLQKQRLAQEQTIINHPEQQVTMPQTSPASQAQHQPANPFMAQNNSFRPPQ